MDEKILTVPMNYEKDLRDKIIELTINWLNDEDYPDHKIWNYFK